MQKFDMRKNKTLVLSISMNYLINVFYDRLF